MRPNIVSEAGLSTRLNQWWGGIPFITSGVVVVCGFIYLLCLLAGYDSFAEICFWPSMVISRFQVYRIYTSILFHGSLLHVMFNMLALVPLGSGLERIMGSVRVLYVIFLLATTNAIFHLLIASVVANNPIHPYHYLMDECAIGFSGVIFSMIVIETSLSGIQSRSVFGLFNVPAKWYAWILLVVFQLLMTNVSLLGHLCGILSGFAYTYGMLNFLLPGSSFYSRIEGSSVLSSCVRRPGFIVGGGGSPTAAQLPTYTSVPLSNSPLSGNMWRNLSSWMPQRLSSVSEPAQESNRFPGRGRVLGSAHISSPSPTVSSDSGLQTRLLDTSASVHQDPPLRTGARISDSRNSSVESAAAHIERIGTTNQTLSNYSDQLQQLVAMGFDKSKAEVALAATGDPSAAVELLTNQG
ncbi:rhomboid-like protein 15 isoform X2 [Nymphaea colorata]|uniref:rhomboid-like protein 15 isoform X2 n=1 Tax=Nymphaea colorata TaxID=210225 RepID=UPI00129E8214|nr:rhomboid-like protein 15 isoform X2 [Nymphaea colorata]